MSQQYVAIALHRLKLQYYESHQTTNHINRILAHIPENIQDWFSQLQGIISLYNNKLSDLWNMDKVGFIIEMG
jgi:hypothetical protein